MPRNPESGPSNDEAQENIEGREERLQKLNKVIEEFCQKYNIDIKDLKEWLPLHNSYEPEVDLRPHMRSGRRAVHERTEQLYDSMRQKIMDSIGFAPGKDKFSEELGKALTLIKIFAIKNDEISEMDLLNSRSTGDEEKDRNFRKVCAEVTKI